MNLETAWGGCFVADPTHSRGLSILNTGIYDIAASEAVARLVESGDTVVDGGANIGYMTVLAGHMAGPGGRVIAFEPHPFLYSRLCEHVRLAESHGCLAGFDLREQALGSTTGEAWLHVPKGFEQNDGLASMISSNDAGEHRLAVSLTTLDELLGVGPVKLLKLDIEGYEAEALLGAKELLKSGRVRNLLFEDHELGTGQVASSLKAYGYEIFSLGWKCFGPVIQPLAMGSLAKAYEAPNFIATLEPSMVMERFMPSGWKVLAKLVKRLPAISAPC
jgi:FkbM family methyltransferase